MSFPFFYKFIFHELCVAFLFSVPSQLTLGICLDEKVIIVSLINQLVLLAKGVAIYDINLDVIHHDFSNRQDHLNIVQCHFLLKIGGSDLKPHKICLFYSLLGFSVQGKRIGLAKHSGFGCQENFVKFLF